MIFLSYAGKTEAFLPDKYNHFQKCAQVVACLCKYLQGNIGHKLFFDNWFTTIDPSIYLKVIGILVLVTVRANRLQDCPLERKKAIEKQGRGSMDYRVDYRDTGLFIVRWTDNSIVHLASNFVGITRMGTMNRWDSHEREKKDIICTKIVNMYNKRMGGADLADILIALYRIRCKTMSWYIKQFWHMVDITEVNAWILYKREEILRGVSEKSLKCLKMPMH